MNILIVSYQLPEANAGSGCHRLLKIIEILQQQGHTVNFFAYNHFWRKQGDTWQITLYKSEMDKLGIDCWSYDQQIFPKESFQKVLGDKDYDLIICEHYFTFDAVEGPAREVSPNTKIILDTVDLHYLREKRSTEIGWEAHDWQSTKAKEIKAMSKADIVWAITDKEKHTIEQLVPNSNVHVVPNIHQPMPSEEIRKYNERKNIVFLGSYVHQPNIDAVYFFVKDILPKIVERNPDIMFDIIGSYPRDCMRTDLQTANSNVIGWVPNSQDVLSNYRVGVVPLRFGSGMKGKIGDYFCTGLPCVTTSIGAEGMRFEGEAIVMDDPDHFAHAVCSLYNSMGMWNIMSKRGRDYVMNLTPDKMTSVVAKALS